MTTTFASAARSFADLVGRIPADAWSGPGLGDWDLRSLVGHTSRSLTTVLTYLETPADREDIATPREYYARVNPAALGLDPADVAERGRQAGRDLGDDPAAAVADLVSRALARLETVDDPLIRVLGGLGIRLRTYLPTRTFELAVHSLDIARAVDLSLTLPGAVLEEALVLAARIAAEHQGETVLMALTGRDSLPPSFSIV
ncbi:maleylpyruvate isomerase N-terminal domain-containing protein [Mycolicibacterium novocastrense]|uniref:Maleylpyruvate isomerase N-terminal domain-containing protein n=1 Tax=Mycolicibacterium novocastrense TaxID=59813 RepID=A0AAW5SJQ6_MYCNV|nr:maleylpyruvate isomerase N-terminal domain-containing protein [Mycolicibacterium novocastrense]MCV7023746.1 maleylpyruvate isomerase N-terminal domain-containing protein [Mycolicibacterium novocastrense]GAT11621.1 mycothiol maleylpyruvate isomerase N-terminal domain protein [Mycolicibacterium novocastrense]